VALKKPISGGVVMEYIGYVTEVLTGFDLLSVLLAALIFLLVLCSH
jgi:hypothetical protein